MMLLPYLFATPSSLFYLSTLPTVVHTQASPPPYLQTPSPRQLAWHQLEYYAFIHFGPNTFTDTEWGTNQPLPDIFDPTNLDTDQWAKTFADAGMTGMILTAKHHDGMCLFHTNTTAYQIGNSAWARNRTALGLETDVVKMAAQSAKKFGLGFGVYLSPWDIHLDPAMPKPLLNGTIFDEPQIFGDDSPGDYNAFYAQQLTELVTMRIPSTSSTSNANANATDKVDLFEIWLDGASGSATTQSFNWTLFRDIIRRKQPNAVMWGNQGVDARWVGNEDGYTTPTNWHTLDATQDDAKLPEGEMLEVGVRDGKYWTPAESDARIRDGWFWHAEEDDKVKNASTLMQIWELTVGRSVNLLLDVPPDTRGLIPAKDAQTLKEFREIREYFLDRNILSRNSSITASSTWNNDSTTFGPSNVLDTNPSTYWAPTSSSTTGTLEIDLNGTYLVDAFIAQEHIALGQRIGGYAIDGYVSGSWQTLVNGTSMGYKRVDKVAALGGVEVSGVRLSITQASDTPLVQRFGVLGRRS